MFKMSDNTLRIVKECCDPLQRLMFELTKVYDYSGVCGYRTPEAQLEAYNKGNSKVKIGKHNVQPSLAIDIQPYPHATKENFIYMGGLVMGLASQMGIPIRWGNDWNRNNDLSDESFHDMYHFEYIGQ